MPAFAFVGTATGCVRVTRPLETFVYRRRGVFFVVVPHRCLPLVSSVSVVLFLHV